MENMQKTGSFKIRGAYYKVSMLPDSRLQKGLLAASAGNHAQGVALAGKEKGVPVTIYMPTCTPEAKINATKAYGAKVILEGDNFQEAYEAALVCESKTGAVFVHPFDDRDVMIGQSTVALEMLQQCPDLDTVIAPIGGGGLMAGTALAVKLLRPSIHLVGVQSSESPAMFERYFGLKVPSSGITMAEGIQVKEPGAATSRIIREWVDDIKLVSEREIAAAIMFLLEREKAFVEGAGAAPLAALLSHRSTIPGRNIGLIVSGGNMDAAKLEKCRLLSDLHQQCAGR